MRTVSLLRTSALAAATVLVACGGSGPPPATASATATTSAAPSPAGPAPSASAAAAPEKQLPTACAPGGGEVCVPDAAFVARLCNGSFPDAALALFAKSQPFTRGYLRGNVDGWNADGASARAKLLFDEEVLVLRKRTANTGGMQVSGSGGYQVMRWDGNCYTLSENEITMHRPPAPKSSAIAWRYLSDATQNALLDDAGVKKAHDKRNHECHGAISGDVTLACQRADEGLSKAIARAVRGGTAIPTPAKLP